MKEYIGVKLIKAEPMTANESLLRSDFKSPAKQNQGDGYKVVYEDGYTSWSPKDVFEKAYKEKLVGYSARISQPYQEQVLEDYRESYKKTFDLDKFISSNDIFLTLELKEQEVMKQQLIAMEYYNTCLIERINNFK